MNERELLPCPFCGQVPTLVQHGEIVGIVCDEGSDCDNSGLCMTFLPAKRETAIACWNRRAALQAAPGREQCNSHPDAPHGFDRNASHSEDRYVCDCESWTPPTSETPRINIRLETHGGSTYIPVIRVEQEDDGSFTAVSNYWPETNSATVEAATIERCAKVCEEVSENWEALPTPQDCADAIRELASQPARPQERCKHGVRLPHECKECEGEASPDEIATFMANIEQPAQQAEAQAGETRGIKPNWKAMYESQLHATLEQADECDRLRNQLRAANDREKLKDQAIDRLIATEEELRAQLAAQPQAVEEGAKVAVCEIVQDLSERMGIGDEWSQIDSDTRDEIMQEWTGIVSRALRNKADAQERE